MPIVRGQPWTYVADPTASGLFTIAPAPYVQQVIIDSAIFGSGVFHGTQTIHGDLDILNDEGGGTISAPNAVFTVVAGGFIESTGNLLVLGDATVNGNLVVGGTINGAAYPPTTGTSLTLSGALSAASVATAEADSRHGPKTLHYGPADMHPAVGAPTYVGGATVNTGWQSTAAADAVDFDVGGLAVGDRVLSVWVYGRASAAQQWSATLFQLNLLTGAVVTLGTVNSGVGAVRLAKQVFNGGFTMPADTILRVQWVSVAAGGMTVHGGECQFDRV